MDNELDEFSLKRESILEDIAIIDNDSDKLWEEISAK